FFIDILHTSSLREFTYLLGREIYETLRPRSRKMADLFIRTLKSLSGQFGFDPFSGTPTFNVELGDIERPEYTLEEIFRYLAEADKPCIVAIDEFQQIAKYPEKNIEALLRTHIQKLSNCHFIFAGSERHMMQEMFTSAARPFYHSADMLELRAIVPEIYIPFIVGHFKKRKRKIEEKNVEKVYDLFKGHTYYIQKTFNEAFADTPQGGECTLEIVQSAIDNMLAANDTVFREILSNIPEKQKELLYAIAKDGEVSRLTSADFIKRHRLISASSVQSAMKKLLEKDFITEINKVFSVTDKLFAMWMARLYGNPMELL
ncbi:MAG: ATPase, partial [Bacteroides sp.]|nr:ATPase [Bacteroides sp.]